MVANTVDDLLNGPTEISWMLFEHVRPIVMEYLQTGRVISIEDVFRGNQREGRRGHIQGPRRRGYTAFRALIPPEGNA